MAGVRVESRPAGSSLATSAHPRPWQFTFRESLVGVSLVGVGLWVYTQWPMAALRGALCFAGIMLSCPLGRRGRSAAVLWVGAGCNRLSDRPHRCRHPVCARQSGGGRCSTLGVDTCCVPVAGAILHRALLPYGGFHRPDGVLGVRNSAILSVPSGRRIWSANWARSQRTTLPIRRRMGNTQRTFPGTNGRTSGLPGTSSTAMSKIMG